MADTKITDLAAAGTLATGDLLPVVDVSDTSMAASGTDKKLTLDGLKGFVTAPVCLLQEVGSFASSSASGTYYFAGTTAIVGGGSSGNIPPRIIGLNTTDWPDVDNLNLHVSLVTTAAQTGVTFTFGLYPVTISGTTSVTYTLGTVVSGSTVAFNAPGAASENRGNSGDFTFPSTDLYVIGVVTDANTAASSRTHFTATLRGTRA